MHRKMPHDQKPSWLNHLCILFLLSSLLIILIFPFKIFMLTEKFGGHKPCILSPNFVFATPPNPLGDFYETWYKEKSHCVDLDNTRGLLSIYF
jgi:hypothetical protein